MTREQLEQPLVKLLQWCRENVPDQRLSLCRVENISPCAHVCAECGRIEKRAKQLEKEAAAR